MISDGDFRLIKYGKVEIGKEIVAYTDVATKVTTERLVDNGPYSTVPEKVFKGLFTTF